LLSWPCLDLRFSAKISYIPWLIQETPKIAIDFFIINHHDMNNNNNVYYLDNISENAIQLNAKWAVGGSSGSASSLRGGISREHTFPLPTAIFSGDAVSQQLQCDHARCCNTTYFSKLERSFVSSITLWRYHSEKSEVLSA
jgi:hypothetical protein